jgi:hypothetical protein
MGWRRRGLRVLEDDHVNGPTEKRADCARECAQGTWSREAVQPTTQSTRVVAFTGEGWTWVAFSVSRSKVSA